MKKLSAVDDTFARAQTAMKIDEFQDAILSYLQVSLIERKSWNILYTHHNFLFKILIFVRFFTCRKRRMMQ